MTNFDPKEPLLDYIFVENTADSTPLALLFTRLFSNMEQLLKDLVCTRCWGLIPQPRWQKHCSGQHERYLISAVRVSSRELYFETAREFGMIV